MNTHHTIYQFSTESGEGEFIVISDLLRAEVLEEHLEEGWDLDGEYALEEDGTSLPCNQRLSHS